MNCSIEDCNRPIRARSWCSKHYRQWRVNGDPLYAKYVKGVGDTPEERFWSRVVVGDRDECWPWRGLPLDASYGYLWYGGEFDGAHRVAWKLHNKKSPENMILHSCDNKPCCNPRHLRDGTQKENMEDMHRRGRRRSTRGMTFKRRRRLQCTKA